MKYLFTVILACGAAMAMAQKFVNATIVGQNNDTINGKMKIYLNPFYDNLIDERSFYKALFLLNDRNIISQKIKPKDVRLLYFTDLKGKARMYANNGAVLKEVMYDGKKIKWYRNLSQNLYDGSVQYVNYLVDDTGREYPLGIFNNARKKLLEATRAKPALADKIEHTKLDDETLLAILKEYDQ